MANKTNWGVSYIDEDGAYNGDVIGNVTGNVTGRAVGVSADYTADGAISVSDSFITVASSTETVELTLADSGDILAGQELVIKCLDVSGGNITITPGSFMDGATITFDAANEYARLIYYANGSTWALIGTDATLT